MKKNYIAPELISVNILAEDCLNSSPTGLGADQNDIMLTWGSTINDIQ